ncbi:Cysteine-rich RLK (receptor-like protein kinase) 8 [Dorcoceras hygrometricum]|uniref:Cysteine-rich RLK (Receptor-like protein kinase) 8 n=1 Tax=Dorcoceras hygrometricum TaxID=472368 RepID=A0A2Z7AB78_9LAMI|nr:Cysteine-rich RLK (receptor-like protein kinase) 8 [Dorcoceras hygrometricum]
MAWLLNSMEPQLSQNFLFLKTAKAIWDVITGTYEYLRNCSQVFGLKTKLGKTKQGNLDVTEYFTLINNLRQELDLFYEANWENQKQCKIPEIYRKTKELRFFD